MPSPKSDCPVESSVASIFRDSSTGSTVSLVRTGSLGFGSFGRVDVCEMQPSRPGGRPETVAVKSVAKDSCCERASDILRSEAAILSKLQHRNIVEFKGVLDGSWGLTSCQVMCVAEEFITGPSLGNLLKQESQLPNHKTQYSDWQGANWMLQLASALEYMHAGHDDLVFIHRDLSINNVLLTSKNLRKAELKLIDFGLAMSVARPVGAVSAEAEGAEGWKDGWKALTTGCGTMLHMAPEVAINASAHGYDHKVDVFSFGMLLFQVFHRTTLSAYLHRNGFTIQNGHSAVLKDWRPSISADCPTPIASLIESCWNSDPAQRPEFREIVEILRSQTSKRSTKPRRMRSWSSLSRFTSALPKYQCCASSAAILTNSMHLHDQQIHMQGMQCVPPASVPSAELSAPPELEAAIGRPAGRSSDGTRRSSSSPRHSDDSDIDSLRRMTHAAEMRVRKPVKQQQAKKAANKA